MNSDTARSAIPCEMDHTLARALGLPRDDGRHAMNHPIPLPSSDFVSFSLYCPSGSGDDPHRIAHLCAKLPAACAALTANHIWSSGQPLIISPRQPAGLDSTAGSSSNMQPHLLASSTLAVAECIDDVWFALWVLKSLTRQFAPHLALTATDADGQFALIEAADHLPSWVDPDSVEHRVWWVGGELMLIPPSVAAHVETEADGAAVVLGSAAQLAAAAPEAVRQHLEHHVFRAIEYSHTLDCGSPQPQAPVHLTPPPTRLPSCRHHHTGMYLPPLAARLLMDGPTTNATTATVSTDQLVALAIHAVHARDPVSMRKSHNMQLLVPTPSTTHVCNSPTLWVKATLRLTRYLYALLDSARVDPVLPALSRAFPDDVPLSLSQSSSAASQSGDAESRKRWRAWHNGAKLALGLEMILCDSATVAAAGVDRWRDARAAIVDWATSPEAEAVYTWANDNAVTAGQDDDDADDWMHVTDEDFQRWTSSSPSKALDVNEVVKAVNAFGDGESGLDGVTTAAECAHTSKSSEAGDTDDDDELLFDPNKFDSLFSPRQHKHTQPGSGDEAVDSDSDFDSGSDLDALMAEHLPGYHGKATEASDSVDEVQVLADLLASLEGQEGRMGPAAGLFAHLGFPLTPDADTADDGSGKGEE